MRGLLEKDFRLTLTRKQTLLIFFMMALIMGISMDNTFVIGYLTMLATIIAVGTLSYDEFDNGFAFLMTLPFERKTYVKEKYLFCFIMNASAWCIGLVFCCVLNIFRGHAAVLPDGIPALIAIIPVMYLATAVMIPLQLKYGPEKSRIVMFILFGAAALLIVGGKQLAGGSDHFLKRASAILDSMSPAAVLLALTAVCVLFTLVSCLVSIRILEKKEF